MVSGSPSATPLAEPKLDVMSLRTMPCSTSTFGPFVPSAGYGPPVSCGIRVQPPVAVAGEPRVVPAGAAVVVVDPPLPVEPPDPQPTRRGPRRRRTASGP